MNKAYLAIILGLIPVISFILMWNFSAQGNTLEEFKGNYGSYLLDWLFVPFNLFFVYAVRLNYKLFSLIFIISLAAVGLVNAIFWTFETNIGIVHLVFAAIEMSLIIASLVSKPIDEKTFIILMVIAGIYFLCSFIIESFVYRPVNIYETSVHLLGILVITIRVIRPQWFKLPQNI